MVSKPKVSVKKADIGYTGKVAKRLVFDAELSAYHELEFWSKPEHASGGNYNFIARTDALATLLSQVPGMMNGWVARNEILVALESGVVWEDVSPYVYGAVVQIAYPQLIGREVQVELMMGTVYFVEYSAFDLMTSGDTGYRVRYDTPPQVGELLIQLPTVDFEAALRMRHN